MPKQKFYSVRKGRVPGIYQTWDACSAQVTGFPGAIYKSFESRDEAERFLRAISPARPSRAKPSGASATQPGTAAPQLPTTAPTPGPTTPPPRTTATQSGPTAPSPGHTAAQSGPTAAQPGTTAPPRRTTAPPDPAAPARDSDSIARIYTDGGCLVNPGPGGYGVVLTVAGKRRELSGGFRRTTNNRMELMACIAGLEAVSAGASAAIYTDSRYLANGISKGWAERWQAMHWERAGEPVPNADLWQRLLALCAQRTVTFQWLRGHAGHPENERCHLLAGEAMRRRLLPPDHGYQPP